MESGWYNEMDVPGRVPEEKTEIVLTDWPPADGQEMPGCRVEGCEGKMEADWLCAKHRRRLQRHGSTDPRMCWGEGCTNFITTRGDFCPGCRPLPPLCSVEGCDLPVCKKTGEFCGRHEYRFWKYGDPGFVLTRNEENRITDDYTRAKLYERHEGGCEEPQFEPYWVWRKNGYQPREGERPLTIGAKLAYRIFCRHQLLMSATTDPITKAEIHQDQYPQCDLYDVNEARYWKEKIGMKPRPGEKPLSRGPHAFRLWCHHQLIPIPPKKSAPAPKTKFGPKNIGAWPKKRAK